MSAKSYIDRHKRSLAHMYVVIVGCSESGYHLSKALIAGGHEVVVVDKNLERFQLLQNELGTVAFFGNGTDESTLKRAGIARADVVISLTGVDATNLVISQMAKHMFHVPRTMALIKDPKNEPIFHEVGIDVSRNTWQAFGSFNESANTWDGASECFHTRRFRHHWQTAE